MSFLVLVIQDREQKALVNQLRHTHPSKNKHLPHYGKAAASTVASVDEPGLELPDDMPIVEAYFREVERSIYSHPKARKMLSLDGDPVRERGNAVRHSPTTMAGKVLRGTQIFIVLALCVRRSCLLRCSCNRWRI